MNIENIIDAIRNSLVRITDHADEEAFDDNLAFEEIYFRSYMEKSLKIIQTINPIQAA